MTKLFYIEYPRNYSFYHTAKSHGWYSLRPFELDEARATLTTVFTSHQGPATVMVTDEGSKMSVEHDGAAARSEVERTVRHIFRLDDDLDGFYAAAKKNGLDWVITHNGGRLLRSPTVWEDLVKTLCTTNCSWGLTKNMVTNLVEKLGEEAADGKRAFPTADAMAGMGEQFYRDEIRTGYRAPFFAELAQSVAAGLIDPESWLVSDLPTPELKKQIKSVKGVGDYAAENLLKLIGRYDGLALDSWLRAQFYERHNGGLQCPDDQIKLHYENFGQWQGVAMWCDMTEKWFDHKPA